MKYSIRIDTDDLRKRDYDHWKEQLFHDICKNLNGLVWTYDTKEGLLTKLNHLTVGYDYEDQEVLKHTMELNHPLYGRRREAIKIPGYMGNYMEPEDLFAALLREGEVHIPFSIYYDLENLNNHFINILDNSYIIMEMRKDLD